MIDYRARSTLAQAARVLVAGRITNYQFENREPESSDPAVKEISYMGFWPLYSDTPEYRLDGDRKLSPEDRLFAARCILFLKSGLRYSWPIPSWWDSTWLQIRSTVTFGRAKREYQEHLSSLGDVDLWPFQSASQYAEALRSPVYLMGLGSNNSFKLNPLRGSA
ncbi:hypothetical protein FZO89_00245 [Luteimonas viscosa]|uniref:Uncharacterized protein n=1 Tax=Luteimonas viscosa TaxID=1132694 RepID=A0A5D4XL34_9GAMM|nr:hypothetical protein [Luteimonas viscosa]TYT24834.1 hypothetical protein FZO89_00245 [Luteimonas viscosa]